MLQSGSLAALEAASGLAAMAVRGDKAIGMTNVQTKANVLATRLRRLD